MPTVEMLKVETIAVSRLAEFHEQKEVELVDVRTPMEFQSIRASIAVNLPLDSLDPGEVLKARGGCCDQPLYVICKSGARGAKACQKFIDAGFTNVLNVDGGTEAWHRAGLPVIRESKMISLDRQVRITAGTIVLLSAIAAMTIHPYFAAIAAAMGAGLAFAAIIDSCVLGMMLAKMPWNQASS